jgi:hypothetical protein
VLKARQGGFSTDQQARALHQIWSQPNFDALTLAHTKEDTEKLFEITTRAIEHFPLEAAADARRLADARDQFPGLDTKFFTGTAGAKRTGRGMTIKRFHGSEFAFWDDPKARSDAVTPGLVPRAASIVLETTASGYGSPAHVFWQTRRRRAATRRSSSRGGNAIARTTGCRCWTMTSSGRSSRKSSDLVERCGSISSRSSGAG